MQTSVPELMDISKEPADDSRAVRRRAGQGVVRQQLPARPPAGRARRALRAALSPRLGHHGASFGEDIVEKLPRLCRQTDRPVAALINDLKQRGLLDDTLVVWGGEFGRTPMNEARNGRTSAATTIRAPSRCGWPAAASSRASTIGSTDELGYNVVEDPVHVHDLHATILHLLGSTTRS